MSKVERIAVLGGGSWGATLAVLLAEKGHDVALWEFVPEAAAAMAKTRRLNLLPELQIPDAMLVTNHLGETLEGRPVIVSATPSHTVRATMGSVKKTNALDPKAVIISVSKGLEENSQKRMSQVISEELHIPSKRVSVLSGPSHAEEVCKHMPTAVVAAAQDRKLAERVKALFETDYFRVYALNDVIGVEYGGTFKNIFAIACGVTDGLGLGDNTRAAIMTRGLNEMTRIGVKMGGQLLTFFGLAGMGDLIVTCLSKHSRNRQLGEMVGRGMPVQEALSQMRMVAEGMKTAPSAFRLAQKLKLETPVTQEIYEVLYKNKSPRASLHDLMNRQTHREWQGLGGRK